MKRLRFLAFLTCLLAVSCVKTPMDMTPEMSDAPGLLQIGLSVDGGVQILKSSAALDPALVPAADSLYIDLYRSSKKTANAVRETWNRVYFGRYADVKDSIMHVNAGNWKMLAFHGDSTACGFDKPYFLAEKSFTVDGGLDEDGNPKLTTINAEARVSNVRISIDFDESIPGSFYDYFVRLTNLDKDRYRQILRYRKDQDKDAYMMASDSLQIEFMAQYEFGNDSSWRFAVLDTLATAPNDHLTISLSVDPRFGNLNVNIHTDGTIIKDTSEIKIKEEWAPQDPPQIVAAGFESTASNVPDHAIVEGDTDGNAATISVVARAGLKNFFVMFESDRLASLGIDLPLGQWIDIADPTSGNKALLDKLEAAGMQWQKDMAGSRKLTYLSLTDFYAGINARLKSQTAVSEIVEVWVKVVDAVDHSTIRSYTASSYPVRQQLVIPEGDVWAWKILSPLAMTERGVSRLFKLQYSKDRQTWTEVSYSSADANGVRFPEIAVEPDTRYYFRSIYNDNPDLVSELVEIHTEQPQQVGNRSFEDYWTTEMTVSIDLSTRKYKREWYLPYLQNETDRWWAVNSRKTMPASHSTAYENFKNYPCTGYSVDGKAGKAAMVFTGNVDWWNTDYSAQGDNIPGEIWIGSATDGGDHDSDGHGFANRPSAIKFWYKYAPKDNETFVVKAWLKDSVGDIIASAEILDGEAASEWTSCVLPLVYSDERTKAAKIYLSFKSCESGSVNLNSTIELAGKQQTTHVGSILWIDEIEMLYTEIE